MMYSWFKTVIPIAGIFAFRMLGLFMLIPVFTLYAPNLQGATPLLVGIALGAYGLSQGLLQIPFGILSDRYGRKSILSLGLILFALGSILGAFSTSIYSLILARILQGTGAIGSVLIALLADLTEDKHRTKAMAVIGLTIGLSFSFAMVLSPIIAENYGFTAIFYLTACLACLGLILLHCVIPTPPTLPFVQQEQKQKISASFHQAVKNPHLLRLNFGIFVQHFILTATFFSVPLILRGQLAANNLSHSWHFYIPILFLSFIAMLPLMLMAETKMRMKKILGLSVLLTSSSQGGLIFFSHQWWPFCVLMFIYFLSFNFLEASLPSLVSRQALLNNKGTAMGIYSSSQFLGIFAGGFVAGIVYPLLGNSGIFLINSLCALFWLIIVYYMQPYSYLTTLNFVYSLQKEKDIQVEAEAEAEAELILRLKKIAGVQEVSLAKDKGIIYLLVNKSLYQEGSIEPLLYNTTQG